MQIPALRRLSTRFKALFLAGVLLLAAGGCPIDGDQVLTSVVRAALESATDSLVETLATHLAGK
jgi:hypothetical protein